MYQLFALSALNQELISFIKFFVNCFRPQLNLIKISINNKKIESIMILIINDVTIPTTYHINMLILL